MVPTTFSLQFLHRFNKYVNQWCLEVAVGGLCYPCAKRLCRTFTYQYVMMGLICFPHVMSCPGCSLKEPCYHSSLSRIKVKTEGLWGSGRREDTEFVHSWAASSVRLTIGQASCCPAAKTEEDGRREADKHVDACVSGFLCVPAWDLKSLCRRHLFCESPTFCSSLSVPLAVGRVDRLWMAVPAVQRRPAAWSQTFNSPY